jgi:hypothetical protein
MLFHVGGQITTKEEKEAAKIAESRGNSRS